MPPPPTPPPLVSFQMAHDFMKFIFQVHDYVKSYVGEGKIQKQFAIDYLERRSRWKNAKKRGTKYEDDLTTPALAITPGDGEFQVEKLNRYCRGV